MIYSTEEKTLLLSQIRLTMSFLQQTGGDREKALVDYMRAFSIDKSLRQLEGFHGIRLKHVLDIFERVEESLHSDLMQRTDPKYQLEIEGQDLTTLRTIARQMRDPDLELVRNALARMCIRQLSSQAIGEQTQLFPVLFMEDNAYLFGIAFDTLER